jgi:TonB family protein
MVSSPLYVSPGAAYFPKHAASPLMAAFERCLLASLERWPLPRPVDRYEGVWLRFHLQPLDADAPEPRTHSALFEQEGTRVLLEVTGQDPYARPAQPEAASALPAGVDVFDANDMTRPQRLSGEPIRYSNEALALRVQGVMVVRCVITREGRIENCRILEPLPYMERNALTSLYSQRYTPVLFAGKPVSVDYTFTLVLKPRS